MIDWISVDDVLYQWNGQEIVCETEVGYSTRLEDHQLDGLEITDSAGNVSGQLFIDFSAGTIAYEPFDEQRSDGSLLYSSDGKEMVVALSQLPIVATLHDVLTIEEDGDLWSSIANESQVHTDDANSVTSLIDLDHQTLLDNDDNTLDLVLQNIDGATPFVADKAESAGLYDFNDQLPINTGVIDPLDSLHFYNAGQGS